eukprot:comp10490_c0_seq1/m.5225 comp10490_c0_seq1/g.5225  ORF comp10490_c0_seq1/g.5225 comp10490_c0_seq1/m.5225 type:complete len:176 (-) comp10490_c0_seq1:36-563(-)
MESDSLLPLATHSSGEDPHVIYDSQLNHLMSQLAETVSDLCKSDPLLRALPPNVSLSELQYMVEALEHEPVRVTVKKRDGSSYDLCLSRQSTVSDLKHLIEHRTSTAEEPLMEPRKISWKYVWKTYHLVCEGVRLTEPHVLLRDYGVRDGATVTFGKTIVVREKGKRKRPQHQNH